MSAWVAAPVGIDDLAAFEQVIQRLPVPLRALLKRLRHLLALAGVVERGQDDARVAVFHQAEPDIGRKDASVLAARMQAGPGRRRIAAGTAFREVLDQRLENEQVVGRQQRVDAKAQRFGARPAEGRLGLAVEFHDRAIGRDLDQGVARQVVHVAQLAPEGRRAGFCALRIQGLVARLEQRSDDLLVGRFQLRALPRAQAHLRQDDVLLQPEQFGSVLAGRLVKLRDVRREIRRRSRFGRGIERFGHGMHSSKGPVSMRRVPEANHPLHTSRADVVRCIGAAFRTAGRWTSVHADDHRLETPSNTTSAKNPDSNFGDRALIS